MTSYEKWESKFLAMTNEERKAMIAKSKEERKAKQAYYYSDETGTLIESDGVTYLF